MNSFPAVLGTILLLVCPLFAQEKATTDSGQKVLLFKDGTWKPEIKVATPNSKTAIFVKSVDSTTKVSIARGKFSLYFNPKKWKQKGPEEGGRSAYEHKDGDGNALILTERTQMPLELFKAQVLTNAKNAAPDAEIFFSETRKVNGHDILAMQIKGNMKGMAIHYYGYYYTGKEGCIQVLTYTTENLFEEFKSDFDEFLNGLVLEP